MEAAQIALYGMDPMRFLETTDPLERTLMQAIAGDADAIERRHDDDRAQKIANAVIKGLGGK